MKALYCKIFVVYSIIKNVSYQKFILHILPYTAKLSRGKTFAVFTVFQPIAKVFPLNHLPCTVHNGMGLMHRESFPVNSVFCAQPRKFSPSKVLPYTIIDIFTVYWYSYGMSIGDIKFCLISIYF